MRLRFLPLGLLSVAALGACEDKKPTAIIVSFSTEARPAGEIDALQVVVRRGGAVPFDTTYDLPRDAPLPGTLTLDNGEGDPSEPVTVEVVASKSGKSRILRRAKLAFSEEKQKLLRMPLRYSCTDFPETCGPEQTCAGYQCVPIEGEVARVRDASVAAERPGARALSTGGSCFDAAACISGAKPVTAAPDCTLDVPFAGGSYNVFMRWKVAPDNPVALDPGDALEGFTLAGGKPKLAPGLCKALSAPSTSTNGALEVSVSDACPPKSSDAEPCTKLSDGGRAGNGGAAGAAGQGGGAIAGKGGAGQGGAGQAGAGGGGVAGASGAGGGGAGGAKAGASGSGGAGGAKAGAAGAGGGGAAGVAGAGGGTVAGGAAGAAGGGGGGGATGGGGGAAGVGGGGACVEGAFTCNGNQASLCLNGVLQAPTTCPFGCDPTNGCNQCKVPADCGVAPECLDFSCNAGTCKQTAQTDGVACGPGGLQVCVAGACANKCVGTGLECMGRQPVQCNFSTGLNEPQGAICPISCVAGACGTVQSLALGADHSCFATDQSEVWCWGKNDLGQLGLGSADGLAHHQPERTLAIGKKLAASAGHACAYDPVGVGMTCWGDDAQKQLGRGATGGGFTASPSPVTWQAAPPSSVDSFATGPGFTLLSWGSLLFSAGDNSLLQFGSSFPASSDVFTMTAMPAPGSLSAGTGHACGIDTDLNIQCWGGNARGQALAAASASELLGPTVLGPADFLAAGGDNTCFHKQGTLYCAGDNTFGQLGFTADTQAHATPVPITPPAPGIWRAVAIGSGFVCAAFNLDVYCWGKNDVGQCGADTGGAPAGVTKVVMPDAPTALAAGVDHVCAAGPKGIVCWGGVTAGKLGRFGTSNAPGPVDFAP